MLNGFFEFGFFALVAFVFVNFVWGVTLLQEAPPIRRTWKDLEQGIPTEGAELITPTPANKIPVG